MPDVVPHPGENVLRSRALSSSLPVVNLPEVLRWSTLPCSAGSEGDGVSRVPIRVIGRGNCEVGAMVLGEKLNEAANLVYNSRIVAGIAI